MFKLNLFIYRSKKFLFKSFKQWTLFFLFDWIIFLEDNLETMFVDLLLMIDYLLQFLDEFEVVFTFWLNLINDLLNFLLYGILSQFWNIFLRIMVKVIIDAVSAEELSIELTISGQFFLFVIITSEKLSFYNRLGLI